MAKAYKLMSVKKILLYAGGYFSLIFGAVVFQTIFNLPIMIPVFVALIFWVFAFRVESDKIEIDSGIVRHYRQGRVISEFDLNGVTSWNFETKISAPRRSYLSAGNGNKEFSDAR